MKKRHGGKREGAGRKPLSPIQGTRRRTVTLTVDEVEYLKHLGDGNVSRGIRKLIDAQRAPGGQGDDTQT